MKNKTKANKIYGLALAAAIFLGGCAGIQQKTQKTQQKQIAYAPADSEISTLIQEDPELRAFQNSFNEGTDSENSGLTKEQPYDGGK
ncbi:MAG: hypothetical protein KKE23_02275 [Nanoarchaeota archaeon]|nr:hypothetical protein [Nanoarchaeota archaeon]